MAVREELNPERVPYHWHWSMFPLIDLVGLELVYAVGLKALGYPPTLVDTQIEANVVDSALMKHLNGEEISEFQF